jgi:hypothetical protein
MATDQSWCRICCCEPARRGRRDGRGPVCAAYWHRYGKDRTEALIVRNNVRRFERTLLAERTLPW